MTLTQAKNCIGRRVLSLEANEGHDHGILASVTPEGLGTVGWDTGTVSTTSIAGLRPERPAERPAHLGGPGKCERCEDLGWGKPA